MVVCFGLLNRVVVMVRVVETMLCVHVKSSFFRHHRPAGYEKQFGL